MIRTKLSGFRAPFAEPVPSRTAIGGATIEGMNDEKKP
jgi:hypothetical protein